MELHCTIVLFVAHSDRLDHYAQVIEHFTRFCCHRRRNLSRACTRRPRRKCLRYKYLRRKRGFLGVIRLPVNETLVLKQRSGKVWYEWHVTYDGESTVLFTRKARLLAGAEQKEIRSPRDVETPVEFGLFRQGLTVKTETGAAYVSYPSGFFSTWTFRPHREPVR